MNEDLLIDLGKVSEETKGEDGLFGEGGGAANKHD
jgi:hypothetical protein